MWEFAPAWPIVVGVLAVALSAIVSYLALSVAGRGAAAGQGTGSPVPTSAIASASAPATLPVTPTLIATLPVWTATDVDRLTALVPTALRNSCTTLDPSNSDSSRSAEAIAAVTCQAEGTPQDVTYELLTDRGAMTSAYQARVAASGIATGSGGCWDGRPGEVDYSYGRALCWIDVAAGLARVAWTDERVGVVAAAAASGSLQALVDWWWNAARVRPAPTTAGLTPDEQFLMDQIPRWLRPSCKAYDATADAAAHKGVVDPVGDLGAIDCIPTDAVLEDVGWFRFTTPAALQAWYARRIAQVGVKANSGGCDLEAAGETSWRAGRIACYRRASNSRAAIRWTNDEARLYGALNGSNNDLSALLSWWQEGNLP